MLSDQFNVSIKVAEFNGTNKQSDFISRKEFGGCCLIKSIYDVLSYLDIRNEVRSYFDPGNPARRDEFLYDKDSFVARLG